MFLIYYEVVQFDEDNFYLVSNGLVFDIKRSCHVMALRLKHNGLAIWGGCVTRRQHQAGSRYSEYSGPESCRGARYAFAKASAPKGGYGVLFAVMVQVLLSITRVAVQV